MMLSVIIPHYPFNEEINDKLRECIASLKGATETLVIVNDGIGYAKAVNQGLKIASCEFIAIVNNDLRLLRGNLKDLCVDKAVTSPVINGNKQDYHGSFWVLPREVFNRVGYLDERFEGGYYEDDDYLRRLKQEGIETRCIESVEVDHAGGTTIKGIDKEKEYANKNRKLFYDKWENQN